MGRCGGLIKIAQGKPAKGFPAHTPFLAKGGKLGSGGSPGVQDIRFGCPVFLLEGESQLPDTMAFSGKAEHIIFYRGDDLAIDAFFAIGYNKTDDLKR